MMQNFKKSIFAFSDTHGKHRNLQVPENVDIVICACDVVEDDLLGGEYDDFIEWFASLPCKWKVFVPGNHELSFELDKAKEITDVQSKKDCVLNSHLIQLLCGIWIFLLNVVHSEAWNQYTVKI